MKSVAIYLVLDLNSGPLKQKRLCVRLDKDDLTSTIQLLISEYCCDSNRKAGIGISACSVYETDLEGFISEMDFEEYDYR